MKLFGDISEEHKRLSLELEELESYFDKKGHALPGHIVAKAYFCMAHDWIELGLDEVGHELFLKAEKACPGYFKGPMLQQCAQDEEFNYLVNNVTALLVRMAIDRIEDSKE